MNNVEKMRDDNSCCFNNCVECNEGKCRKCGWNPAVADQRVSAWQAKRSQQRSQ